MLVPVRQPGTGKLLFKYDPQTNQVQIKAPGCDHADTVDLEKYRKPAEAKETKPAGTEEKKPAR